MCSFSFCTLFSQPCASCSSRLIFYVATFGLRLTVNTWMIEFSFSGTWCSRGHEWSLLHSLQWECPHLCRRADDLLWQLWNGVSEQELQTNRCANPWESAMSVSCRQSFSICWDDARFAWPACGKLPTLLRVSCCEYVSSVYHTFAGGRLCKQKHTIGSV